MQGKTTFILTDRDTGKIVEKREEHNIVTNAIKDIFDFPNMGFYNGNTFSVLNCYIPMYTKLLHGLVLFGDNIPEKTDDYLLYGRYKVIATAGTEYTGADAMRGTFNKNQSGEIENGYRFVWDFAPEKAIGTIKCASLSSIITGNTGGTFSAGSIMVNVVDFNPSISSMIDMLNAPTPYDFFAMSLGKNYYYYYSNNYTAETQITIRKYYMPHPDNIGITTPREGYLEKQYYGKSPVNTRQMFINDYDKKMYFFNFYSPLGNYSKTCVQIAGMDIETGECKRVVEDHVETPVDTLKSTKCYGALFNNQLYVYVDSELYVIELDGTFVRSVKLDISSFNCFFVFDGRLWINGKYSLSNSNCIVSVSGTPVYLPLSSSLEPYNIKDNVNLKCPYVMSTYSKHSPIMLRTDYLATINNLSEPLEKIDRHALQVRYEITN